MDRALGNRNCRVDGAWRIADSRGRDAGARADLGALLCMARAARQISRKLFGANADRVSRLHGADGANDDALQNAGESPDRTRGQRRRTPTTDDQLAPPHRAAGLLGYRKHTARPPDAQYADAGY